MDKFHVIIPARLDSTRLPGKVLLDIDGKPMLQHVFERATESGAESVVIATDNEKIQSVAEKFGAQVWMTSPDHETGSDRIAEAVSALGFEEDDLIVNVQGDEPLIPPVVIHQLAETLSAHESVKVATLYEPITTVEELMNPSVVKVVLTRRSFAMYFSRAPIPWAKGAYPPKSDKDLCKLHHRHIGMYAYRAGFLGEYMKWEPCPLEEVEGLEQLRALWRGVRVHVTLAKESVPSSVDTQEDLDKVRKIIEAAKKKQKVAA